jgi:hypothetical protein
LICGGFTSHFPYYSQALLKACNARSFSIASLKLLPPRWALTRRLARKE